MLLFFSMFFYCWGEAEMAVTMMASIFINYAFGIWISDAKTKTSAKWLLVGSLIANIGLLAYFKYANFFADNYNFAASALGFEPRYWEKVMLPLGISFFTFHGLSYVIDIYRKQIDVQRNFLKLALYISLFPQLIAGPIVRYRDISQQIDKRDMDIDLFYSGVKRFIIGFAKKILLANMLGRIPNFVYQMPVDEYNALFNWLALIAGGLQIYYDFSGYSDMAIGLGRMFGFKFLENFNYPYISKSIKEFWTRWHISLSTWFRDYVYIPLGGNKKGKLRTYVNLWIVFLLTGFWHGANWTFIMFGVIHGFFLSIERMGFEKVLRFFPNILRNLYVFFIFSASIVLFDMKDLYQSYKFFKNLFDFQHIDKYSKLFLFLTPEWIFIFCLSIVLCGTWHLKFIEKIKYIQFKRVVEVISILLVFILSIAEMTNSSFNPFIYFRF